MTKPTNADFFSFIGRSLTANLKETGDKDLTVLETLKDLTKATRESVEDSKKDPENE